MHVSETVRDGGNNDSVELLFNQKAISNGMTSRMTFCDVFVWFTKSLADGKDNKERKDKERERKNRNRENCGFYLTTLWVHSCYRTVCQSRNQTCNPGSFKVQAIAINIRGAVDKI